MDAFKAAVAASMLVASISFPAPVLSADTAPEAGICENPYITRQTARGRAHWYLIKRGFSRTADGKPRVIMGNAKCVDDYWHVKVTLVDYAPKAKHSETILVHANSGNVVRNISIIS